MYVVMITEGCQTSVQIYGGPKNSYISKLSKSDTNSFELDPIDKEKRLYKIYAKELGSGTVTFYFMDRYHKKYSDELTLSV